MQTDPAKAGPLIWALAASTKITGDINETKLEYQIVTLGSDVIVNI